MTMSEFAAQWEGASYKLARNLEQAKIISSIGRGAAILTRDNITDSSYRGVKYAPIQDSTIRRRAYRLKKFGRTNRPSMLEENTGEPGFERKRPPFSEDKPLVETGILWNSISYDTRKRGLGKFRIRVFSDKRSFNNADERHKRPYLYYHNETFNPIRQVFAHEHTHNEEIDELALALLTDRDGINIFSGLPGSWSGTLSATDRVVNIQHSRAHALGYDK